MRQTRACSGLLVTGATGFVGAAIVRQAHALGWPVTGTSRRAPEPTLRACAARWHDGLELHADTDWRPALDGIDTVIHCAARVHQLSDRAQDPLQAFRAVNRDATLALARQAADQGVRRFVFVSSIGVNGATSGDRPFDADSLPHPHSPYAVSKWEAEQALFELGARTGLSISAVRPPMVLGANAPGNVQRLLRAIDRGWPLPFGAIRNQRSFVSCRNLVDLLLRLAEHPAADGVWLVCDDEAVSTPELIRRLARALDTSASLVPVPAGLLSAGLGLLGKRDLVNSLVATLRVDAGRARRELGWIPPSTLDQALHETAQAYRARQQGPRQGPALAA